MTELPMFPLGSVLFPHMPLQLRVFEERYLVMLSRMLDAEATELGVVLIERGQEVGGGEHRFSTGTVARVIQLGVLEASVGLVAEGGRRFEVIEWLDENPHPRAVVRELLDLQWSDALRPLRERAELTVRRALAVASEFTEQSWSAEVTLSEEPVAAAWQLAAIAPLGPLDQVSLLRSTSVEQLLETVIECTIAAAESFSARWPGDGSSEAPWPEEGPFD